MVDVELLRRRNNFTLRFVCFLLVYLQPKRHKMTKFLFSRDVCNTPSDMYIVRQFNVKFSNF